MSDERAQSCSHCIPYTDTEDERCANCNHPKSEHWDYMQAREDERRARDYFFMGQKVERERDAERARAEKAEAGEAYERKRADTLVEENAYFCEEAEMLGKLVYRIVEALGREWREETDDDAEKIALGAIAELQADRDRLSAQNAKLRRVVVQIHAMAEHDLNRGDDWHDSNLPQIEADARAALKGDA